jgi:DNA-binding NarL/FixJ family response regulator
LRIRRAGCHPESVARRPDIAAPVFGALDDCTDTAPPARVRTLIVDDSAAVREGLSRLLSAKPFCELIGAVSDPAVALERTRALRPDVVLQDFSMPGVDPFALMRALSSCRPRPALLVLSAFADSQAARLALEAGAIGWVLKDAEPEQLFAALLTAVGFRDCSPAVAGEPARIEGAATLAPAPTPEPDGGASLDARTVWALLRALHNDPAGLTPESLASRAVLPIGIAVRYLQRLASRCPALVAPVEGPGAGGAWLLTSAGQRELARLERRRPVAQP